MLKSRVFFVSGRLHQQLCPTSLVLLIGLLILARLEEAADAVANTKDNEEDTEHRKEVTATLLAGDANNDNAITTADYLLLKVSFGSQAGDPNWNDGAADFNCDGIVSTADYLLLKQNFGQVGAP